MKVSYKIKSVERLRNGRLGAWLGVLEIKETCEWNWLRELFGKELKVEVSERQKLPPSEST